jgi:hypothetical protein
MSTIIGFTGTREGMTPEQRRVFVELLLPYHGDIEFHHGDCLGADSDAHDLVLGIDHLEASEFDPSIVIHPPSDDRLRARRRAVEEYGDRILDPKPYLDRNRDIVDACSLLIACPKETWPVAGTAALDGVRLKGGTWYTIRYAQRAGKTVAIIYADGVLRKTS